MTVQPHSDDPKRGAEKGELGESQTPIIAAQPPKTELSRASEPVPAKQMSAEEQMAHFEKDLKENDWGHQPC